MIYVGMDLHKKSTTFCAIDEEGSVVRRGQVPSGHEGWRQILSYWPVEQIRVALETGSMTWWAVDELREAGVEPTVVDARQFKMIADSKKKSDRFDARALADGLRGGLAERCAITVPSQRAHRHGP